MLRCGARPGPAATPSSTLCGGHLARAGLPESAVSLIEDTTHASRQRPDDGQGAGGSADPRGGAGLIRACVENATVPCIQTGTGICHVYVDEAADLDKAVDIIENAKASRPCVCNAEEVCLVHSAVAESSCPCCKSAWWLTAPPQGQPRWSCGWTERAAAIIPGTPAGGADFDTEFLDYILAVKVVDSVDEAIAHIAAHSTGHSEAIVTGTRPMPPFHGGWTAPPCMSTAPPALPTAESSGWAARWASPPRSSTPAAPWAGRTVQLQVHHPERPDPLNRSNVKAIFRFSLTGRCGRTAACIFVLQGWTVFAAETLSPQNSEKYFSVRITMYFSFLHSVQK